VVGFAYERFPLSLNHPFPLHSLLLLFYDLLFALCRQSGLGTSQQSGVSHATAQPSAGDDRWRSWPNLGTTREMWWKSSGFRAATLTLPARWFSMTAVRKAEAHRGHGGVRGQVADRSEGPIRGHGTAVGDRHGGPET